MRSPVALFPRLLMMGLSLPLLAGSVESFNLRDITERADRIFQGRCIALEHVVVKSRSGKTEIPAMRYTFAVIDRLKGETGNRVQVTHLGRFQDGRPFLLDPDQLGIPRYEKGGIYLLFVGRETYHGLCSATGLGQGVFDIERGLAKSRAGNSFILTGFHKALAGTPHAVLAPTTEAGKQALSRKGIPIEGFKALIRDLLVGKVQAPFLREVMR